MEPTGNQMSSESEWQMMRDPGKQETGPMNRECLRERDGAESRSQENIR